MKHEIKFYNSIIFRTVLGIVIGFLIFIIIQMLLYKKRVNTYVNEDWIQEETLIATAVSNYYKDCDCDLDKFLKDKNFNHFKELFNKTDLDKIYFEILDIEKSKGFELFYINKKGFKNKEDSINTSEWYPIYEDKKELNNPRTKYIITEYTASDKIDRLSFMQSIKKLKDKKLIVVGLDLQKKEVNQWEQERVKTYLKMSGIYYVIFCIVITIIMRLLILKPIRKINGFLLLPAKEIIDGDKKIEYEKKDEIGIIANNYNIMLDKIREYVFLIDDMNQTKKQIETQMEVAYKIQDGLLPKSIYSNNEINIDATMYLNGFTGGDFYDYQMIDDDKMYFLIADVSGKGISAALFMASAVMAIRGNIKLTSSPSKILELSNNDLVRYNPQQMFITMFIAVYDKKQGTLTYTNAGHNKPYLVNETVTMLNGAEGLIMGMFENETYEEETIKLNCADYLFMYTDGVNEAIDEQKNMFGLERITTNLKYAYDNKLNPTEYIIDKIEAFRGEAKQNDDITMLGVLFNKEYKFEFEPKVSNLKILKPYIINNGLINSDLRKKIYLALEEIYTNICFYAFKNRDSNLNDTKEYIKIEISIEKDMLTMVFIDNGMPYNPLEDVITSDEYLDEMSIGGLGKMLTFTITDEQNYEYIDNNNILTLKKYL